MKKFFAILAITMSTLTPIGTAAFAAPCPLGTPLNFACSANGSLIQLPQLNKEEMLQNRFNAITDGINFDTMSKDAESNLSDQITSAIMETFELGVRAFENRDFFTAVKTFESCEEFCAMRAAAQPPHLHNLKIIALGQLAKQRIAEALQDIEKKKFEGPFEEGPMHRAKNNVEILEHEKKNVANK